MSETGKKKGHGAKSAAVREQAILALLSERSIKRAAKRAGIHEHTLRTWLTEDAAFRAEYDRARRAAFEAGISGIQALTESAVETLGQLLKATKHPAVRLGAARTVVEIGLHQHDAETILQKLSEIEAAQGQRR